MPGVSTICDRSSDHCFKARVILGKIVETVIVATLHYED